jgi:outer membrane receptor protein involved in Fe transport
VQDADGDGNPNVHGSRSRDFQAVVGNVSNVDPLTGQYLSRINTNSIEEMEVITAGAGVEFGRAQGGFARIIQKQGSNKHEGVVEVYWRTSKLDGDGANDESELPEPEFDSVQPGFQFSGPLKKDKLWYRASYERIDDEVPINVLSGIEIFEQERETQDMQVTWQVSPRNKLALQFRGDPTEQRNAGISNRVRPESSRSLDREVETWTVNWTAPYSPKVLVESTFAWQDINIDTGPTRPGLRNDCVPNATQAFINEAYCTDLTRNIVSGSWFRTLDDHRQRFTLKSQATVYGGRFWGMSHQFKLGINVENERYFRFLDERSVI